jgi:multimeric flavodoxin WrbA
MKVLMLNGSSKTAGCTFTALTEIGKTLQQQGIDYEIFQLGAGPVRDCTGCQKCGDCSCIFTDDGVNEFLKKAQEADGFVFGTPVYYAHPSGRILSFLDRVFYCSGSRPFRLKPAAAVASARRAGTTASIDVLNKYFGITQMITVGSTYWNMVHGQTPEDVMKDEEGLQTMRNVGRTMAWMLKCIAAGEEKGVELPLPEKTFRTNFIH